MAAPIRFTITLARTKRFEFLIYPTLGEMRTAIADAPPKASASTARNWMAACILPAAKEKSPYIARLFFCEKHVTDEYVAHECVHAAMAFVKWLGDSPETDNGNETLAAASGLLVGKFWKRWRRSAT